MADSEPAQTKVPVKVPGPEDNAPPSLAGPASGPAAEMSGALPADPSSEAKPTETPGEIAITSGEKMMLTPSRRCDCEWRCRCRSRDHQGHTGGNHRGRSRTSRRH